ncbi:hypothetical protein BBJ28_00008729 [Nothophytophthora sp. Chile5]|nr:hypothetical protein BBJ28_00008729 [Nothophytophthora sp. Chile5]
MATDGLQVDRTQSNAMNLQVLKRQDDAVMEIVDTASHVVMYEFDQATQSWKRKDVEGCLFVVKSLIQSLKDPQNAAIAAAAPANSKPKPQPQPQPAKAQAPAPTQTQPKQQQQAPSPSQQQQQEQQQPRSRGRSRNKRDDSKRRGSNGSNPVTILQRSPKGNGSSSGSSSGGSTNGTAKQENVPVAANSSGMVPISKADGIAAGEAIMGMISQNRPQQQHPRQKKPPVVAASNVSKEQLKQTLIGLLDDAQFFDQIYHAYVDRVAKRA